MVDDKICTDMPCKAEFAGGDGPSRRIMAKFKEEYEKLVPGANDTLKKMKILKKLLQKKWYDANIYVKTNKSIFKNPELFNNYSDEEQTLLDLFRGRLAYRLFYQKVGLLFQTETTETGDQTVPDEMHGFWTAQQKDLFAKVLSDPEMHKLYEPITKMDKFPYHMRPTDSNILKNEIAAAVAGKVPTGGRKRRKKKSIRRKTKHKRKRKRKSKTKRKRKRNKQKNY